MPSQPDPIVSKPKTAATARTAHPDAFTRDIQDLLNHIQFDVRQGKIWFGGQRMLLNHAHALWRLREDLVASLGETLTQGVFFRYGYYAGVEDAEISKKLRPNHSWKEVFLSGPQLHTIRGMVKVVPETLNIDIDKGEFHATFNWYNSVEVSYHKKYHGLSDSPVCYSLLGYASGYCSYFFGRLIAFKETQCAAMGHDHCHIEGKPLEQWGEDTDLARFFQTERLNTELFERRSDIDEIKRQNSEHDMDKLGFFSGVGESKAFKEAVKLLAKVAKTKASVLLQGETGVGKEVFAQGLHDASDRSHNPFIAINCASIPSELIESELFGVDKGAYTGATHNRKGKFELANTGTLFLDEVVELSPRAQASLLRVLQDSSVTHVGGVSSITVDVRVVVASNENLVESVRQGKFREDLYYRLSTFPIHIPPLRHRQQDILLLAQFFLKKYAAMYQKNIDGFTDKAREQLNRHHWPGNVRELQNVIERAVILNNNTRLLDATELTLLPGCPVAASQIATNAEATSSPMLSVSAHSGSLHEATASELKITELQQLVASPDFDLEAFNQQLIHAALSHCNHNVSQAARLLKISRAKLDYRLHKIDS